MNVPFSGWLELMQIVERRLADQAAEGSDHAVRGARPDLGRARRRFAAHASPRGRVQAFLALLLIHRGDTVHLDRIVDELWGEPGPRHAKNAVHVLASRLRGAGLGDAVVFEGGGYALRAPNASLDADLFEAGLRRGRAELASGQAGRAAVTLATALALWRGPALLDVSDAPFAQPEIARLEDLRLTCVGERIEADLACGREAEVTGELESLVHKHPFRERLRGQLMTALYRSGRQAEALATYREAGERWSRDSASSPRPGCASWSGRSCGTGSFNEISAYCR